MAVQNTQRTSESASTPAIGDFPFPLSDGPEEPQYLTWVRNHSNYMVTRGFLDYMRTVAALARGIIVNFLIFLPFLLIVSIALGLSHEAMLRNPFYLTGGVLAGAFVLILFFTICVPVFRILRHKRSLETGSESSIKQRDLYERFFGALLFLILSVAALESFPWLLEFLHDQLRTGEFQWKAPLVTVFGAVAVLSGADKVLSLLGGLKKKAAMGLIAIVGLVLPLVVILYTTRFLLYGPVLPNWFTLLPLAFPIVLFFAVQIGVFYAIYGWLWQRVFRAREIAAIQLRLLGGFSVLILLAGLVNFQMYIDAETIHEARESVRRLESLAKRIDRSWLIDSGLKPEAANLVSKVIEQSKPRKNQRTSDEHSGSVEISATSSTPTDDGGFEKFLIKSVGFIVDLDAYRTIRTEKVHLYDAQPLIQSVRNLARLPSDDLIPLRDEIAIQAPHELLEPIKDELLAQNYPAEAPPDEGVDGALRKKLRLKFVDTIVEFAVWELEYYLDYPDSTVGTGEEGEGVEAALEELAIRGETRIEYYDRLVKEYGIPYAVRRQHARRLQESSVANIAELLSNRQLKTLLVGKIGEGELNRESRRDESRQELIHGLTDKQHARAAARVVISDFDAAFDDPAKMAEMISSKLREHATSGLEPEEVLFAPEEASLDPNGLAYADLVFGELFPDPDAYVSAEDRRAQTRFAVELAFGELALLEPTYLRNLANVFSTKAVFLGLLAFSIWFVWRFTVDVNLTSIHALYRDRLAAAFLIGRDAEGRVGIEEDIDLEEICHHQAGSIAPYHLINVALNLQGSKDVGIRDRQSDFFIFSKRFIGGNRTGYCRSHTMEQVFPQMDLATAMAISAAAASPNMGRGTSPLLVAFMTLLNIRLGFWLPNPGLLEENLTGRSFRKIRKEQKKTRKVPGFSLEEVFEQELDEVRSRWNNVYGENTEAERGQLTTVPTAANRLIGIALSGGGIRSAAINLGITQALHKRGVFDHLDYMSTVSGGGYLGSSISTLMRFRDVDNQFERGEPHMALQKARLALRRSKIHGVVTSVESGTNEKIVRVKPRSAGWVRRMIAGILESVRGPGVDSQSTDLQRDVPDQDREYRFSKFDRVVVKQGGKVKRGHDLIARHDTIPTRFRWRIRPMAFLREMLSRLDETHRWVNLSDGGHIENLATIELLRRRCKYIIVGDAEADPNLHFGGLATLMRCAYIDLGIEIDINLDAIRLKKANEDDAEATLSDAHWAIGKIMYPESEEGYLLYLKSSFTDDENETIREYRHSNPSFPHQSTADQFFDGAQFGAYRALGQHIADMALDSQHIAELADETRPVTPVEPMSFGEVEKWFEELWQNRNAVQPAARA